MQQLWRTQQWPQDWKKSVFIPIPKKGNLKECSSYHTIELISQPSKVMLKILGKPRGSGWRGRWEGGSGWGTHVNPWLFHFNVWQNSLQIKKKKSEKKILQARLQQYVKHKFPDVQVGKGSGTRYQTDNFHWIIEKAREFKKNIYFCFMDYTKVFDCVDHNKLENS